MDDTTHAYHRKYFIFRRSRRTTTVILLFFSTVVVSWWSSLPTPVSPSSAEEYHVPEQIISPKLQEESWDSRVLRGPPAEHFRDAIRPDVSYLTSWPGAGWTNDVMTFANLIYLSIITERIPIIPPFTPSHVLQEGPASDIHFGDVFDVPRMRKLMKMPILEWRNVKSRDNAQTDELGCWNVWEASQYHESHPRRSSAPDILSLDVSYTLAPSWIKLIPNYEHDSHTSFWALARLGFSDTRDISLVKPLPSPKNVSLPPDEQLLCYDYLYYVCAQQPYEWETKYSPAWRFVAQYMHFNPILEGLANAYVNRAIGLPDNHLTPPYISIHIRRADFIQMCGDIVKDECFPPLSAFARRVQEVKEELFERKSITIDDVIVTSDEKDSDWWEEVANLGWLRPDHSQTKALYGTWYPVLIDAAIQSAGAGFVGTARSTMSIIAMRRVDAWQDGAIRLVEWGWPGADDH